MGIYTVSQLFSVHKTPLVIDVSWYSMYCKVRWYDMFAQSLFEDQTFQFLEGKAAALTALHKWGGAHQTSNHLQKPNL